MIHTVAIVVLGLLGLNLVPAAQEPELAFEVASVKPNRSGDVSMDITRLVGNDFSVVNAPLRDLIRYAYEVADYELVGAPGWTTQERFDIQAKGPTPPARTLQPVQTSPERLMLRTLLADRFKLAVHREMREMPIYALVKARESGQLGPEIRRTQTDCTAIKSVPPVSGGALLCGFRNTGTGVFTANAVSMSAFARFLTGQVKRVVVDMTGLSGSWDAQLKWTPDRLNVDVAPGDGPTLFTALQEQLGLKLEATRGLVEVLVVDSVDRPSSD